MQIFAILAGQYTFTVVDVTAMKGSKGVNSGVISRFAIAVLIACGAVACSSSGSKTEFNISCVNESGSTKWGDGSVQQLTNNLGTEVFTWKKIRI